MNIFKTCLTLSSLALVFICDPPASAGANEPASQHPGLSAGAEQALKRFKVPNGLEIKLFASEPMVRNPTDMDIDERGRVWITEGVNYRSTFQSWGILQPAGDRIIILEDTDGDGVADKETVFYQGPEINAALGICVLGNKVIVSSSPNIYVFTDTDGDGKADKKEILFSGISGVDHDHGAHAFTFGPDGKLYFNFGNAGEQIKDKDGKPIKDPSGHEINASGNPYRMGMVFRCNVDGSGLEVLGCNFRNPYEVASDSFGTLWQSDNDDDGNRATRINYVMEHGNYGYVDEFTGDGWDRKRSNWEEKIPERHWHQNDPGVVPNLFITGSGAPTGIAIYEGKLMENLVQGRIILADAGSRTIRSYAAKNVGAGYSVEGTDLLTSDDTWFRPSDVCVAPDGSIYVADWNDAGVGGHNMADRKLETMTGRVYRIAPIGNKPGVPHLDFKTASGAVTALQSPNISTRYLAWNALQSMPDQANGELTKTWRKNPDPVMRARALYLLAQQPGKTSACIKKALVDKDADIRIVGLRIAREAKLDLIPYVKALAHDPSAAVRRECAIALRLNPSPEAPKLWATLAQQHDGNDRWYLEALGIGAQEQEEAFFDAWLLAVGNQWNTPAGRDIVWRSRSPKSATILAKIITNESTPSAERAKYIRAFDFIKGPGKNSALHELASLSKNLTKPSDREFVAGEVLDRFETADVESAANLKELLATVLAGKRGTPEYLHIVEHFQLKGQNSELLQLAVGHENDPTSVEALRYILISHDVSVLKDAIQDTNTASKLAGALGSTGLPQTLPLLMPVVTDPKYDIATRRKAVISICQIKEGAAEILQLAHQGKLPGDIKLVATMELEQSHWPEVKAEAAQILPPPQGKNAEVLPPMSKLLAMKGNPANGAKIFVGDQVACIKCHRVNEKGVDLGPALSEIGTKLGKDALYEAILDPSAGISFGYEAWHVESKSGDEIDGIVKNETADEITIKDARAIPIRILKKDIVKREKLKTSLMPAGLQQAMSTQELVDLVEYLSSLKKAGQ